MQPRTLPYTLQLPFVQQWPASSERHPGLRRSSWPGLPFGGPISAVCLPHCCPVVSILISTCQGLAEEELTVSALAQIEPAVPLKNPHHHFLYIPAPGSAPLVYCVLALAQRGHSDLLVGCCQRLLHTLLSRQLSDRTLGSL